MGYGYELIVGRRTFDRILVMKAYIQSISYYLPEKVVTNEDLVREFPEWTVNKIAEKVGIGKRHVAAPDETALDMAVKAAELLFKEHDIQKNSIDYILFCTQSPDYFLPTSACIIQDRLGVPTSAGALDFNLGCSGYIYGLSLAKGLICGGVAKNVLLLTGETYTKHLHPRDKGNRTIFGDAATATLVSTEGFAEIGNFSLGTDGKGAGNLILKNGGMRFPGHSDGKAELDESGNPVSDDYIYMNGSEIFTFTLDRVPGLVKEVLAKNGLSKEEIDLFIFHQANRYMLDFLRKKMKIGEDHFYYCLNDFGNTVSNTIPIALAEAKGERRIEKGQNILLAGFGVGYSWAGCLLKA